MSSNFTKVETHTMPQQNYTISRSTKAELHIIQTLAYQIWPVAYKEILSAAQVEYMLAKMYATEVLSADWDNGVIFLLLSVNEHPSGFAAYQQVAPAVYKLHKLYLSPTLQGLGLGKILFHYIVSEVSKHGATALQLQVNRQNNAFDFYKKLGFEVLYEADFDMGNGYFMNDYVMELKI